MLIKKRKHFKNAREINGTGILSNIIGSISSAAASETGKAVTKGLTDGAISGLKSGAEQGTKELVKAGFKKLEPSEKKQQFTLTPRTNSSNDTRINELVKNIRSGSGIKIIK